MEQRTSNAEPPRIVGRYMLHREIASGGMATVRFGRLLGPVGFSRTVAIKCLHPQFAKDPEFTTMFLDEARVAARVRHPNVVPILDVVALEGELFIVMEYVEGESLSRLLRASRTQRSRAPLRIIASVMSGVLDGLHATHEALSEQGEPLGIVHRDVSPQNVIVGLDGVARVLDFGVAKAVGRLQTTREGQLKGKIAYMAPEQLRGRNIDRRADIYAAAVVLWEALTNQRLFKADDEVGIFGLVLEGNVAPPSAVVPNLPKGFDEVCMRGLDRDPAKRFQTARDMAIALERVIGVASPREVGSWVVQLAKETLNKRAELIAEIESVSSLSYVDNLSQASSQQPSELAAAPSGPPVAQQQGHLRLPSDVPSVVTLNSARTSGAEGFDLSSQGASTTSVVVVSHPQSKLLWTVVVIALLAAGVAITALVILLRSPARMQGPVVASQVPSASVTVPVVAATPTATETAEAKPVDSVVVEPPAALKPQVPASKGGKSNTGASTSKGTTADPPKSDSPKPEQPAKSDCNPPYTIDSRGVKVPKPQCL